MSAKAYTMKELKSIVEYINQHKHYGQIRGRKMWLDFASSGVTSRTWQSLKETFLKRILPDIHNPYYKLTKDEIHSFRTGEDVVNKTKNKLTFETASSTTSTNDSKKVNGQPSTSTSRKENENNIQTGEDTSNKKKDRSLRDSVETVIIPSDDCYETTEELIKTLESKESPKKLERKTLSLRDRIVYTDPLLPIIQDIVDDFESELEVDKNKDLNTKKNEENVETIQEEIVKSEPKENELENIEEEINKGNTEIVENKIVIGKKQSKDNKKKLSRKKEHDKKEKSKETDKSKTELVQSRSQVETKDKNKDALDVVTSTEIDKEKNKSQNNSSTPLTDTLIPNNQEAVEKRKSAELPTTQELLKSAVNTNLKRNKRTSSTQISNSEQSDFQKRKRRSLSAETTKILVKPTQAENKEYDKNSNKKVKDENNKENNITSKISEKSLEVDVKNTNDKIVKPLKSCLKDLSEVLLTADSDSSESEKDLRTNSTSKVSNSLPIEPSYSPVPCEIDEVINKNDNIKTKAETSNQTSPVKKALVVSNEKPGPSNINKGRNISTSKKEIVVLNSHTESDSEDDFQPVTKKTNLNNNSRKNVLKNLFRHSNGVVKNPRHRKFSHHRESLMRQSIQLSSDSDSEWTSDSDEEHYVPAPRSRNYAYKKYLKPRSSRLLSLGQEGCTFVACGKKIYPIIQDGKKVKSFTTYLSESDTSSDNDSYWKLKYVEEKKKTAELKKLINSLQEQEPCPVNVIGSPILQSKHTTKNTTNNQPRRNEQNQRVTEVIPTNTRDDNGLVNNEKVIRIKYVKDNVEVFLEGQYNNIQPILTNVLGLMQNEQKPVISEVNGEQKSDVAIPQVVFSSGKSTPVVTEKADEETQQRVTEIEQKIFKEIEELEKSELEENNVTERNKQARPGKKTKPVSPMKSSKRLKISTDSEQQRSDAEIIINESKLKLIVDNLPPRRRGKWIKRPKSQREVKKSVEKPLETNNSEIQADDETDVLYKFPSPEPSGTKKPKIKSNSNLNKNKT